MTTVERPGFEEIPLDLSRVPTIEQGLADAAVRYRGFVDLAKDSLGSGDDAALFRQHLPYMSFINRASSLHLGVVGAVKETNPHAAFTLLRAYLELVVLVYYLDANPDYLTALEKPMWELPKNTRKRFSDLFEFAAKELSGVRRAYEVLNEMAHFGSTALWHPFTVDEENEEHLTLGFYTGPRWRKPDDARTALAMLQESDEAMAEVMRRYATHHISPQVEGHRVWERWQSAGRAVVASVGGTTESDEPRAWLTLPPDVMAEALAAGLVYECAEHDAIEISEGVTPEDFEAWIVTRKP
jgi:hypothetical protein